MGFDGLEILGFVIRDHDTRTRVLLSIILHGVYEFCRFWRFSGVQHTYGEARVPHAIIHFAITGSASHNNVHTRHALHTLRALLSSPIL